MKKNKKTYLKKYNDRLQISYGIGWLVIFVTTASIANAQTDQSNKSDWRGVIGLGAEHSLSSLNTKSQIQYSPLSYGSNINRRAESYNTDLLFSVGIEKDLKVTPSTSYGKGYTSSNHTAFIRHELSIGKNATQISDNVEVELFPEYRILRRDLLSNYEYLSQSLAWYPSFELDLYSFLKENPQRFLDIDWANPSKDDFLSHYITQPTPPPVLIEPPHNEPPSEEAPIQPPPIDAAPPPVFEPVQPPVEQFDIMSYLRSQNPLLVKQIEQDVTLQSFLERVEWTPELAASIDWLDPMNDPVLLALLSTQSSGQGSPTHKMNTPSFNQNLFPAIQTKLDVAIDMYASYSFNIGIKSGRDKSWGVYGILGASVGKMNIALSNNYGLNYKNEGLLLMGEVGLGIQKEISEHFSIYGEYRYKRSVDDVYKRISEGFLTADTFGYLESESLRVGMRYNF